MACSARMISVVSPSVSLSVASSSSSSSAFASASVTLPRGSNGLSKSLPTRLVASGSNSLFLKRKLILHSSTNFGEAKRSVISAGRIRLEMVIASMLGTSLASGTHFPAYENLYSPLHVQSSDLPLVGNIAPNFEAEAVLDQEFVKIKLSDYIGKKYVVVFFYPLDFTFVCPTEITAFSDKYPEFEQLNTEVIGVSTDSVFSHLAWIQTDRKSGGLGELKYPLVSDLTKKISKAFNVLIVDQAIALRGLFIIDKEGIIQHATINNLSIGRSVEETLRTLQAVQYVQENPDEVCPVEWKPGEKTMKHDSKLSKEYFAAI